jgi:hypothetical protein
VKWQAQVHPQVLGGRACQNPRLQRTMHSPQQPAALLQLGVQLQGVQVPPAVQRRLDCTQPAAGRSDMACAPNSGSWQATKACWLVPSPGLMPTHVSVHRTPGLPSLRCVAGPPGAPRRGGETAPVKSRR